MLLQYAPAYTYKKWTNISRVENIWQEEIEESPQLMEVVL